jgi:DNA-directed RNA polymerase subunit L
MKQLGLREINTVVSYIGVHGGYLGDFTYATHASFYPEYCGLDIDPYQYEGTTRQRFMEILKNASPQDQAKILLGVLEKYPLSYFEEQKDGGYLTQYEYEMKVKAHAKITQWIDELRGVIPIADLRHDIEFVRKTLDQCDILISNHSYGSAVDRAHTALHGYLDQICKDAGLEFAAADPNIMEMWQKIKAEHPKFRINVQENNKPVNQIVNAISKVLHNLNDIRNKQTYSHPNEEIIDENEAQLVINLSRVLLQYIDRKVTE